MLTLSTKHKRRLYMIMFILIGVSSAIALTLYALRQNINVFYTPSQILRSEVPSDRHFRVGGLVMKGSVQHQTNSLTVTFLLSDTAHEIPVIFTGVLPDLFREGQGVVAEGKMDPKGVFVADRVLAKHDENYMPPEVRQALAEAKRGRDAH